MTDNAARIFNLDVYQIPFPEPEEGQMNRIGLSEIQPRISEILKTINAGETITITWEGKEVARLVPPSDKRSVGRRKLANLCQTAVVGELLSPLGERWGAAE